MLWNHKDVILTTVVAVFVFESSDQLNVLKEWLLLNWCLVEIFDKFNHFFVCDFKDGLHVLSIEVRLIMIVR